MGREAMLDACYEVFEQLENPDASDPGEHSFLDFLSWFADNTIEFIEDILRQSDKKIEDQSALDVFYSLMSLQIILGFGMGFALGSVGSLLRNPKLQAHVELIRDAIVQNNLVNHLDPDKPRRATA
jgi:hypothetical protein